MRVDEFDFTLPESAIATRPAEPRDTARLLHVAGAGLIDRTVRDLPGLLAPGDLLVVNNTRVIPARLFGHRGEVAVELLLHKRDPGGGEVWEAFARPAKRLKPGQTVVISDGFSAEVLGRTEAGLVRLAFNLVGDDFRRGLEIHGHIPLPPYIRRADDGQDRSDYQTAFARHEGSVAAPTAGLHFTPDLLAALDARGVERMEVTLHVGAGTFLPVSVDDTDDHVMHAEWGQVTEEQAGRIRDVRARGNRVVAVGTTSLRLLETAARSGEISAFSGETDLFITPGFRFHAVDMLMTNFHLPKSTLFMLVCAFAGTDHMKAAYDHAIESGYRFYSYGDACLLEPGS